MGRRTGSCTGRRKRALWYPAAWLRRHGDTGVGPLAESPFQLRTYSRGGRQQTRWFWIMTEEEQYIWKNYQHLMTPTERKADRSFYGRAKSEALGDSSVARTMQERFVSSDPAVLGLLDQTFESFSESVVARILKEQRDELFFNYCPRCGALTITPRARQCRRCYHSWHEAQGSPDAPSTPRPN